MSVSYQVSWRLPNGKWAAQRITVEILSEHETVAEAADACKKAQQKDAHTEENK